ncbi:hypothetical protein ACFL54_02310 [Planctomycetota bacterium]
MTSGERSIKEKLVSETICSLDFVKSDLGDNPSEELTEENLAEYLKEIPGVKAAIKEKQPALLYFYSPKTTTKQGRACRKLAKQDFFKGLDVKLGLTAQLFYCAKIDVTEIEEEDNPLFNIESAPAMVVVDKGGTLVQQIAGDDIKGRSLQAAMDKALKQSELDPKTYLRDTTKHIKNIQKNEKKKIKLEADLKKIEKEKKRAESANLTGIVTKLRKKEDSTKKKIEKLDKDIKKSSDLVSKCVNDFWLS